MLKGAKGYVCDDLPASVLQTIMPRKKERRKVPARGRQVGAEAELGTLVARKYTLEKRWVWDLPSTQP